MEQATVDASGYADYVERPTDEKFAELAKLVERQLRAETNVALAQEALNNAQAELKQVCETELPEFMEKVMGLEECTTRDGLKVRVKENIRAGISKERAAEAFAWLRGNGHARLIKHIVKTEFSKGEDAEASKLAKVLEKAGFEFEDIESVHAQTLAAFVRERLEAGAELPLELLGVHRQRVSVIAAKK